MSFDLMIPFGILIVLVIYLIYTRNKFEKNIISMYEKKFEEWKKNSSSSNSEKKVCKQLVALVFKEEYNLTIEILDNSVTSQIKRGKFNIKDK